MSFKGANVLQAIKEEISRFENVHPCIYAVYDILDTLPDNMCDLVDQFRSHVATIEDAFVNSQEWTLSRSVKEIRLGIVGSVGSGRSALVHRYLTGTYSQEESPEGGRFKKEITCDNHSYLLLIRDEGTPPDPQFTHWVDGVIFVYACDNEETFEFLRTAYNRMSHFRNLSGLPILLVGSQDGITESTPRVIDEKSARRLYQEIHASVFLEVCAAYGLHIERVFQEACQRIILFLANHGLLFNSNSTTVANTIPSSVANHLYHQQQGAMSAPPPLASKPVPALRSTKSPEQNSTGGNNAIRHITPGDLPRVPVQLSSASTTSLTSASSLQQQYQSGSSALPVNSAFHQTRPPLAPPGTAPPPFSNANTSNGSASKPNSHLPPGAVPTPISRHLQQLSSSELGGGGSTSTQQDTWQQQQQQARPPSASAVPPDSQTADLTGLGGGIRSVNNANNRTPSSGQQQQQQVGGRKSLGSGRVGPAPPWAGGADQQPGMAASLMQQLVSHLHKSNSFTDSDGIQAAQQQQSATKDSSNSNSPPDVSLAETPGETQQPRKTKRRSNIFSRSNKDSNNIDSANNHENTNGSTGASGKGGGRIVPTKEGILHKRTGKGGGALSRETWKKKYVVLLPDGRLVYHPNMHDYLNGEHGKVISLRHSTVKVPGGLPAGSSTGEQPAADTSGNNGSTASQQQSAKQSTSEKPPPAPSTKRGGRRSRAKADDDGAAPVPSTEFTLVSLDGKQWLFDCASSEERDEWVTAIQRQIVNSLVQGGNDAGSRLQSAVTRSIRAVAGNQSCADCASPDPAWAVYNLGLVVCIECSGVHRQLGVHVSRVKSLDLDDWPTELVSVMLAIGNHIANAVLEANLKNVTKPSKNSTRDEREWFVRAKYEQHLFAAPLSLHGGNQADASAVHQQLIDAVASENISRVLTALCHAGGHAALSADLSAEVSRPYSAADRRTALHVAVQLDSLPLVQLLLLYQADIAARDHDGRTPLDYARSTPVAALLQFSAAQHASNNTRPT